MEHGPFRLPSGKLTVRPWQTGVGRLVKPLKIGDFQGLQVYLPEGIFQIIYLLKECDVP